MILVQTTFYAKTLNDYLLNHPELQVGVDLSTDPYGDRLLLGSC